MKLLFSIFTDSSLKREYELLRKVIQELSNPATVALYQSDKDGIYLSGLLYDTTLPGFEDSFNVNEAVEELIYYGKQLDISRDLGDHPLDVYSTAVTPATLAQDLTEVLNRFPEFSKEIQREKKSLQRKLEKWFASRNSPRLGVAE